jgi:hypothetical protein
MNNKLTYQPSVVMDVLPWPQGYGFTGRDAWWQHTLSQSERDRLDDLLALALLDATVCKQLVTSRDPDLLDAFDLSPETQEWLTSIKASNLKEFASAVLVAFGSEQQEVTPEAA